MIVKRFGPVDPPQGFRPFTVSITFQSAEEAYQMWSRTNPSWTNFIALHHEQLHKKFQRPNCASDINHLLFEEIEDGLQAQGLGMDDD